MTDPNPPFADLHVHSFYSLCDATPSPAALVARAAELGMPAMGLTDHDAVYGIVEFVQAAHEAGIHPVVGAELTLEDGAHLTLLVEAQGGWRNLCALISEAQRQAPKGQAALPLAVLQEHTAGLLALSGCRRGIVAAPLARGDTAAARAAAIWLRDRFGPQHAWIELQHHLHPGDDALVDDLANLADELGLGVVATNNTHYLDPTDAPLQDILVATRHNIRLDDAGPLLRGNAEYYLKSGAGLAPLFASYPCAMANTVRIAERCSFTPRFGVQDLPVMPTLDGMSAVSYLAHLCEAALPRCYPDALEAARAQLAHELQIIEQLGLSNYFLVVADIVRFARGRGIRIQGRGSAANAIVAHLLDISPIDPLRYGLVFERFLSPEHPILPDIDLDTQGDRREEVIQYLFATYGTHSAAMACTFVTYRARSALRDVARALDLRPAQIRAAQAALEGEQPDAPGGDSALALVANLCRRLEHIPRHVGQHNGGLVICGAPLATYLATEPATMEGRVVVQWDKRSIEAAGLVKLDVLSLQRLAAIAETERVIEETTGEAPALERLTFDDPRVYALLCSGKTLGVFQVESPAQSQLLPRLQPKCFDDILIATSLIRPGPIQAGTVHPYLRRRRGEEPVSYAHPLLEDALRETLGILVYQEQVLKVAHAVGGFSHGLGERLRRALGAKDAAGEIERLREAFLSGAQSRGVPGAVARTIFEQLKAFGNYAFAKAHAAAFAVVVYWSAWLKIYHPAAFYVGILNHQPMGFWDPSVIVGDARRNGVHVLPVDIVRSAATCRLEDDGIRLGFNYILGMGEANGARVVEARADALFRDLANLCRRTQLPRSTVAALIQAGALDAWKIPRRQLLWDLRTLRYQEAELELVIPADALALPDLSPAEAVDWEYAATGLSTGDHPLARFRPWLQANGILSSIDLAACRAGQRVRVAGVLLVRQTPPTAKGVTFLSLEDEAGLVRVILYPQLARRYAQYLHGGHLLVAEGTIQLQAGTPDMLGSRIVPLTIQ
ncbi:MAG TPA: error-prone DNA polymerase [Roseiflexaceae bacterium]|nr:error-prone DNA polymerase [Roseiflexaceae bacterium]